MIKAILLVPEEGDPHNLLGEGPCGARPPMATAPRTRPGHWYPWGSGDEPGEALVLAWEGRPAVAGLFRALPADVGYHTKLCAYILGGDNLEFNARMLRKSLREAGAIVLLDEDGLEVQS